MLWEHGHYYCLRMDALVTASTRKTKVIVVWARMLWLSDALETRTILWFVHGCSGYPTHSNIEKRDAWYSQYFGQSNTLSVWLVPRRPHPERSAKYAFFARLRSGGANNKNIMNDNAKP